LDSTIGLPQARRIVEESRKRSPGGDYVEQHVQEQLLDLQVLAYQHLALRLCQLRQCANGSGEGGRDGMAAAPAVLATGATGGQLPVLPPIFDDDPNGMMMIDGEDDF